MTKLAVPAAVAAASFVIASSATAQLVIDDYAAPIDCAGSLLLTAFSPGDSISAADNGISLAGTTGNRTTTLAINSIAAAGFFAEGLVQNGSTAGGTLIDGNFVTPAGTLLAVGNSFDAEDIQLTLAYAFDDVVDLAAAGNAFEFSVNSMDFDADSRPGNFSSLELQLDIFTLSGNDPFALSIADEGFCTIDFTTFSGVDFSQVTGLDITFGATVVDGDFDFSTFRVVPTPGSAAALALGGLLAARRRR